MYRIKLRFDNTHGGDTTAITVDFSEGLLENAVLKALILGGEHEALQVRWSGRCTYVGLPETELPEGTSQNGDSNDFRIGQVIFHPGLREVGFVYGDCIFRDKVAIYDCFVIGEVVASDREALVELGNDIHRNGWRRVYTVQRTAVKGDPDPDCLVCGKKMVFRKGSIRDGKSYMGFFCPDHECKGAPAWIDE